MLHANYLKSVTRNKNQDKKIRELTEEDGDLTTRIVALENRGRHLQADETKSTHTEDFHVSPASGDAVLRVETVSNDATLKLVNSTTGNETTLSHEAGGNTKLTGGNLLALMNETAGFAGTTTVGNGSVLTSSSTYCVLDAQGTGTQGIRLPNLDSTNADIMCVGGLEGSVAYDSGLGRIIFKDSTTTKRVVADDSTTQTAYLPINHNMTLRSTAVPGFVGGTSFWTTLSGSQYPTLTITVQTNDLIRVTGTFVEDYSDYAHISNFYRLVVRRGSAGGALISLLDPDHVLCSSGGDNATEHAQLTWPPTTHYITESDQGLLWIGWEIKRRTTDTVTLVAEGTASQKQVSSVALVHLRRVEVPTV